LCGAFSAPHKKARGKKAKINKKITYTQTETLADCHLIFKVNDTGERYSPTLPYPLSLYVRGSRSHLSRQLDLDLSNPARDCASYFSSFPLLSLTLSSLLFLCICFTTLVLYLLRLCVKITLLKMQPELNFSELIFIHLHIHTPPSSRPGKLRIEKKKPEHWLTSRFAFSGGKSKNFVDRKI